MNNKMKKFNKILMMTVAILLTLVLASTSVVSGIFAKYVVTQTAKTTVSLKAFGLTLDVTGNEKTGIAKKLNDNTVAVSMDVDLAPGEFVDNAIHIEISGTTPGVNAANLKITVVTTGANSFSVESGKITGVSAGNYIPFSFTGKKGTTTGTILSAWSKPENDTALQNSIANGIRSGLGFDQTSGLASNAAAIKVVEDKEITLSSFDFGFSCYGKGDTGVTGFTEAQADQVQTYLNQKPSLPTITITYTISLEQVV